MVSYLMMCTHFCCIYIVLFVKFLHFNEFFYHFLSHDHISLDWVFVGFMKGETSLINISLSLSTQT